MIQMSNVTMIYENGNVKAIDDVSLTVKEGEFAFLVGPSGSGKTTIIKLLTGEVAAVDGELEVNGFDLRRMRRGKLPKLRRTLGVIFQDFRLIENKTVYENVAFAMRIIGASRSEIKERVPHVLELVGLQGRVNSPAVSSSVLRSHVRLSTIPRSSSRTSRRVTSIRFAALRL